MKEGLNQKEEIDIISAGRLSRRCCEFETRDGKRGRRIVELIECGSTGREKAGLMMRGAGKVEGNEEAAKSNDTDDSDSDKDGGGGSNSDIQQCSVLYTTRCSVVATFSSSSGSGSQRQNECDRRRMTGQATHAHAQEVGGRLATTLPATN